MGRIWPTVTPPHVSRWANAEHTHCTELLLSSPQRVDIDVWELTTFPHCIRYFVVWGFLKGLLYHRNSGIHMRTIVTFGKIFALTQRLAFFAVRTIYFCNNRQFFAVRAHRRSLADRPGGPLVHQHLLAGLCCIFTSTCLLDLLHFHQHLLAGLFCTKLVTGP